MVKKYSVFAFDIEENKTFADELNSDADTLPEARIIAKKQAEQWCQTNYGEKIVKVDPNYLKMFGSKKGKKLVDGYVCDVDINASIIKKNY